MKTCHVMEDTLSVTHIDRLYLSLPFQCAQVLNAYTHILHLITGNAKIQQPLYNIYHADQFVSGFYTHTDQFFELDKYIQFANDIPTTFF